MADSVEKVLEERRAEKAKAARSKIRMLNEQLIRAAVEPVVKSMSSEERDAIGARFTEEMVRQLGTLDRETETLARFAPEEVRRYL